MAKYSGRLTIVLDLRGNRPIRKTSKKLQNYMSDFFDNMFDNNEVELWSATYNCEDMGLVDVNADDLAEALDKAVELIVMLNSQNESEETEEMAALLERYREQKEKE